MQGKIWSLLLAALMIAGGAIELAQATSSLQRGYASYYSHAGRTASGERYDSNQFTAAHRTLRFGTRVRVTDPRTRRSVVVRINDRGPFIRGRIIDLSRAAASQLGIIRRGVARVEIEVVR